MIARKNIQRNNEHPSFSYLCRCGKNKVLSHPGQVACINLAITIQIDPRIA